MLEKFFATQYGQSFTIAGSLTIVAVALAMGIVISLTYMLAHRKKGYTSAFTLTLVIVPTVISIIILLVGNNIARAFSLAGAFSLIRYRSEPGNPKDIAYVFFGLAIGLACGIGYIGYAILFTLILCLLLILLEAIHFGERKYSYMTLKILVPENLNYQGAFDDILSEYTKSFRLLKVKTTDFGTMFEVTYVITMPTDADQKEFIDKLRCRNGNMNIVLTLRNSENSVAAAN